MLHSTQLLKTTDNIFNSVRPRLLKVLDCSQGQMNIEIVISLWDTGTMEAINVISIFRIGYFVGYSSWLYCKCQRDTPHIRR